MSRPLLALAIAAAVLADRSALALEFEVQEISDRLTIGYAVTLADVNSDQKTDIVIADADRVVWFENPTWREHSLAQGQTRRDNVCLAAEDIDGDGKLDFALGADWRPFDTQSGGTVQWLAQGEADGDWQVHAIGEEPTVHRLRFADLDSDGASELIVVPLMGRNSTRPLWNEQGVRMLAFRRPDDPRRKPWPVEVLNDELHVVHNFCTSDLNDDGNLEILAASFEGISLLSRQQTGWKRTLLGAGNQETSPERGASEVKSGRLATGAPYVASIEPWHGFQVVVYNPPAGGAPSADQLWERSILDEDLKWGHAVWTANLDQDADEELIIGVRDNGAPGDPASKVLCGLRIYDPLSDKPGEWRAERVDPGGVAIEDLAAADLDGDGKTDIVAAGRQTRNVRIYWNRTLDAPGR